MHTTQLQIQARFINIPGSVSTQKAIINRYTVSMLTMSPLHI